MSFRREAYVPKGGPDGGDGGKGGDVRIKANQNLHTLLDCQYQQLYRAKNGMPGSGNNRIGKSADDMIINVPVGTQIFDAQTGILVSDLNEPEAEIIIAKGGRGGKGNAHFATSRNRAPRKFQEGELGIERELRLELKLIADVGLVGLPNSGKSTLVSSVSNARPKIADYPFTTKVPALGVVRISGRDFVMADIPGLIEGAHLGSGMGDRFLRHIERTKVLIHLIDPSPLLEPDAKTRFSIIMNELRSYGVDFLNKHMLIAITKLDIPENQEPADELESFLVNEGYKVYKISAVTGYGIKDLIRRISKTLSKIDSAA